MHLLVTRDSVHASDDIDPPHQRRFEIEQPVDVLRLVETVAKTGYLPLIMGGKATWVVLSPVPVCIYTQQTGTATSVSMDVRLGELEQHDGIFRLHFSYLAQLEPELVHVVLLRLSRSREIL